MINLRKLFLKGAEEERKQREQEQKEKAGKLRAGNTGYIVGSDIHGRCAREAVMRYYGVDKDFPVSRKIMFAAGELMENLLIDKISKGYDGEIATQQEAAVQWQTEASDGTKIDVLGSPDIVLKKQNIAELVVECKMVSSYWTMREVSPWGVNGGHPKADHLAQACHYMHKLGQQQGEDYIYGVIAYVCPNDYHIHTKDIRYSNAKRDNIIYNDQGQVFKVEASLVLYYLTIDTNGRLAYREESSDKVIPTEITIDGIDKYYRLVADHVVQKKLPPRMINTDCQGNKLTWNRYDPKYNDYHDLHDAYDRGQITFEEFIALAKERC